MESAAVRNLGHGEASGGQEHFRLINPDLVHIFLEGISCDLFEQFAEINGVQVDDIRHPG